MSWSSIGKVVAEFAPLLGGVIGGPAGAGIGGIVASVFGGGSSDDVIKAIKKDPTEASIKLLEIQLNHKATLEKMVIAESMAMMADTQDARDNHKHSIIPAILVCTLTAGLMAFIAALMFVNVPDENLRLIDTVFGSYITAWFGSLAYWNGTTRSSADKSNQIKGK